MIDYNKFAEKIKEKYPEYSNIDNLTLSKKIVDKYPEYKSSVSFESPSEMRERAKKEYASDVLQQKLDAKKEKPITNFIFPKTLESKIDNDSYSGQVGSSIKDIFSLPGRIASRVISGPRENLETIKQDYPVVGFASELSRDIVEDPLLPLSFGLGAVGAFPKVVKYAPLASKLMLSPWTQAGTQGLLNVFGESDNDKNLGDAVLSFGIGALPDVVMAGIGNKLSKYGKIAKNLDEIKSADETISKKSRDISQIEQTQLEKGMETVPEIETPEDLEAAITIGRRKDPDGSEQVSSLEDELKEAVDIKKQKQEYLVKLKEQGERSGLLGAGIGAVVGNQLFPGVGGILGGAATGLLAPRIESAGKKIADKLTEGVGRVVQKKAVQATIPVFTDERIKALGRRALADLAEGTRERSDVMAYTRALETLKHNPKDIQALKIYNDYNGL